MKYIIDPEDIDDDGFYKDDLDFDLDWFEDEDEDDDIWREDDDEFTY